MAQTRVAVLRGGPSPLYDMSLKAGHAALEQLPEGTYDVRDIYIDHEGTWYSRGISTEPGRALTGVDVALITLQGYYGEDGLIQRILETHGVPYTGARIFGSAMALDKGRTRKQFGTCAGVRTPRWHLLYTADIGDAYQEAAQATFDVFGPPYIIKPLREGNSRGIRIAESLKVLPDVIAEALSEYEAVIVEEFIQGQQITCAVIEDFRDQQLYTLPPVEVVLPGGTSYFDTDTKTQETYTALCPGTCTHTNKERIQQAARHAHTTLGLSQYSRSDFVLAPSGIYYLETNTAPDIAQNSLLSHSLDAVGVSMPHFLEHLISLSKRT